MRRSVTISLPPQLTRDLDRIAREEGTSRSEVVRDALMRQFALREFRRVQSRLVGKALAAGIVTDEDALRAIS
jgi:metal-responsive CopG/Arc/MetJ family transcriptional regulator